MKTSKKLRIVEKALEMIESDEEILSCLAIRNAEGVVSVSFSEVAEEYGNLFDKYHFKAWFTSDDYRSFDIKECRALMLVTFWHYLNGDIEI